VANTVETFGGDDTFILRPKHETPLAFLEEVAVVILDCGVKRLYVLADESTKSAYSVRLNGKSIPFTSQIEQAAKGQ
jgi:hypothetical protein